MLTITREILREIARHGRQAYPAECCGILVGSKGERKEILRAYPARNLREDRPGDRYEIDPLEYWRVDQKLQDEDSIGLEILGFYHSHPDHFPEPSVWDLEYAWPGHSYLIFSLNAGEAGRFKSWILDESEVKFNEEPLHICGKPPMPASPPASFPSPRR